MSKYRVFSGPFFPVFRPEKTPYLETFHAVQLFPVASQVCSSLKPYILETFQKQLDSSILWGFSREKAFSSRKNLFLGKGDLDLPVSYSKST